MRRTSFVGALAAIAFGGILAFGIQHSPKDLDLHASGLIIMLAGIADLSLRFLIANSPLFSRTTADVAAIVEPVGEPVLDAFGNPIVTAESEVRPPLIVPDVQTTRTLPVVEAVEPPPAPPPSASDQVIRQPDDHRTDEALVPVSALTGRPMRRRRRRTR